MTTAGSALLDLLPVLYRLRDEEIASRLGGQLTTAERSELAALETLGGGADPDDVEHRELLRAKAVRGPLAAFLELIAEQLTVLTDGVDQLYDDLFVETAAPWALAYLGDLIGYRLLSEAGPGHPGTVDRRAEIGHTIAFRRRKGTAYILEQLASDVTGLPGAAVVELFTRLSTTQSMNHIRKTNRVTAAVRDGAAADRVGTAFETFTRSLDVRAIESGAPRPNVANIACFLWRLDALRHTQSPAVGVAAGDKRFRFHPLDIDCQLVQRPEGEEVISHLAEPANVPIPVTRRYLQDNLARLYGPDRSFAVWLGDDLVAGEDIVAANLADVGAQWMRTAPAGKVAVDPELGRLAVSANDSPKVTVTFHRAGINGAFGGEYRRAHTFGPAVARLIQVPGEQPTIQAALDELGGDGVVEITDSGRYSENLTITAAANSKIQVRAAEGHQPTLALTGMLTGQGGDNSEIELNGLLISQRPVMVPNNSALARLTVRHCTVVPGARLNHDGSPRTPGALGIDVRSDSTEVVVEHSIVGAIKGRERTRISLSDSIVDATDIDDPSSPKKPALSAGEGAATGIVTAESSTILGTVTVHQLSVSNSIVLGRVRATNRQAGCARFSYLPSDSRAPRRYYCAPAVPADVPHFTSLRFASSAYARLHAGTSQAIRSGAEDESEMGAHHRLQERQRAADLLTRLDEYLPLGLRAGLIYET